MTRSPVSAGAGVSCARRPAASVTKFAAAGDGQIGSERREGLGALVGGVKNYLHPGAEFPAVSSSRCNWRRGS